MKTRLPLHVLYFGMALLFSWHHPRAAAELPYSYYPPTPPEQAVPAWKLMQNGGTTLYEGGKLVVESSFAKRHYYGIGQNKKGILWGDGDAWPEMKEGKILEVRVKCSSENHTAPIFQLYLRDGTTQWVLNFHQTSINKAPVDTSDWDTYKVHLQDGLLYLSSERRGAILTVRGSPDERSRSLFFGSYAISNDENAVAQQRRWELEFLRWHADDKSSP